MRRNALAALVPRPPAPRPAHRLVIANAPRHCERPVIIASAPSSLQAPPAVIASAAKQSRNTPRPTAGLLRRCAPRNDGDARDPLTAVIAGPPLCRAPLRRHHGAGTSRRTPRAVTRYRREVLNTLAEVAFGTGGLSVIAGTVGVIAFMAFFAGTEVGIQGYASLSQIGVAKFTAFISAYFNTREVAPLVSSIALAATVGCGYTARLGSMRISEEIDALEVMAVPSLPFLVTSGEPKSRISRAFPPTSSK